MRPGEPLARLPLHPDDMHAEIAIVGNGVAGYACAARLAKHGLRPLLIGRGLPIDKPPLSKSALLKGEPVLLADAARLDERGIDRLDAMVDDADLASRSLVAGGHEVTADAIVLATGLSYKPPPIPGLDVAHVNAVPGPMRRLAAAVADGRKDVAVVGGGLVGVESALTFAGAGHQVTVIDLLARPLDRLHDPIPALAASFLAEAGVAFVGGAALEEVVAGPDGLVTVCYKGGSVAAEVVVAATGGRVVAPPGVGPERTLPLEVGPDMALPGLEHVYAIGDLVVAPHARFGPIRFPQWDGAIGTGEQAADAIAGVAGSYVRLPYWWSDLGTHRLAEVGWAGAVVEWRDEDGLHVGQDDDGGVAAVLVVDEPRRVREARTLVQDAD